MANFSSHDTRHYVPRQRWTAIDEEQLKVLISEGKRDPEIAKIMGKHVRAVNHHRIHHFGASRMGFKWTEAADIELKRLWGELKSGSQCASELALTFGYKFSRSSILGRINRIGGLDRRRLAPMDGAVLSRKRR